MRARSRSLSGSLLILLVAFLTGPVAAQAGDRFVICGADGAKRLVAFDFETGAPAPVAPAFHDCEDCLFAAPFLLATASSVTGPPPPPRHRLVRAAPALRVAARLSRRARAPPLSKTA